jgi:hypothetical protein
MVYVTTIFLIFGWDPIITSIFMALIFLVLAVVIYMTARRGSEAVSKMEAGLRIIFKNPPTRFYDIQEIPSENIIRELVGSNNPRSNDKGRGCNLIPHDDDAGFDIRCDAMPDTAGMKLLKQGRIDEIELREKLLIGLLFTIFGVLVGVATFLGVLTGVALYILWIVFLFSFFLVMLEARILKMWGFIITWAGFNTLFTFIVTDLYFVWTAWGAWICMTIIIVLLYIISKNACIKKEAWYCEFL